MTHTLTTPIAPEQAEAWMRDLLDQVGPECAERLLLTLVREREAVMGVLRGDFEGALVREAHESLGLHRLRQSLADTARRWREEDAQLQQSWWRGALRVLGVRA